CTTDPSRSITIFGLIIMEDYW
nr:immunoglobulin heavy chain junction region [Macaca mulatta]MOV88298.1 immunoglobulin heavy chain junction region [Macaca mulatta]MOV88668.1 immunoglobulin heavy chain junction region [Macaca mulatta]MOV89930.1 immunoglobulin heavy chain junction region [Macaca mulatta]MOV90447.1 immunoglobulin heavy chain junction region [Macaca mulatta]